MIVRDRRLRWPIAAKLESIVRNQTVRSVDRRAKYFLIHLDTGRLIIHLGMSGSLRLVGRGTPVETVNVYEQHLLVQIDQTLHQRTIEEVKKVSKAGSPVEFPRAAGSQTHG